MLVYLSLKSPLHHLGATLRSSGDTVDLCRLVLRRRGSRARESVITSETQAALEIHNSVPSLHLSSPPGQAPLGSFIFVLMAALDNGAAEKSQNVKTQNNSAFPLSKRQRGVDRRPETDPLLLLPKLSDFCPEALAVRKFASTLKAWLMDYCPSASTFSIRHL